MVPLCLHCHDLVHDRAGARTDTLGILSQEGRGALRLLTVDERDARNWRHTHVLAILRSNPGSLADPPLLVHVRSRSGHRFQEWVPWLTHTLRSDDALAQKVRQSRRPHTARSFAE